MARPITTRRPTAAELRQLRQLLQTTTNCQQLRRAEAIVMHAEGWDATAIAHFLALHPHTVQTYLHAFDRGGLDWIRQDHRGGAPTRITPEQQAALCRLADQAAATLGLPYGRWSLAKLRDYAVKHRLVRSISCEYLRRVLEKGGSSSAASSASSSAQTLNGPRFCGGFEPFGGTCRPVGCWCSSMSRSCPSRPTVASATPRPVVWSFPGTRRRGASSTCLCSTKLIGGVAAGPSSPARGRPMLAGSCDESAAGMRAARCGWLWTKTAPIRVSAERLAT
jgi:transposase